MTATGDIAPETMSALGALSEALETAERARGHLYAFHQLSGTADRKLGEAIEELEKAGHSEIAKRLTDQLQGANVIEGRWSFQIVEDYDDNYWTLFRRLEHQARHELAGGRRHLLEACMKQERRTS